MAEKSFGVKDLNIVGASGDPTIESNGDLNLKACLLYTSPSPRD